MKNKNNTPGKREKRSLSLIRPALAAFVFLVISIFTGLPAKAHCDSYDGPVIVDAEKALETYKVELVLKWVSAAQEEDITRLFRKTYEYRNGDREVYGLLKEHFLEALVRLHRETEGAPYTGLKPAGSTKPIIQMSDNALAAGSADELLTRLGGHIEKALREKYEKVAELSKVKDDSVAQGREYVMAYVDYTHTIEALHDILDHGAGHAGH